ncbi:unnamed protein product [Rhizoctonia solani]|uniref:Protein kinase domain-containing protein n=1 Tax=Rhizoctonia solani TaxID=456999 RepID=A0A8H3DSE5_9AGAM|nr:unnamed protein product [Rhizoctonia solani]
MDEPRTAIKLNFYVIGDPPKRLIAMDLFHDATISDLILDFVEMYRKIGYGEVLEPTVFKVERSRDDLGPRDDDEELVGIDEVGEHWPEPDKINKKQIHVLVHATVRFSYLDNLGEINSSQAAKHSNFRVQQRKNGHILNGRPASLAGPPTVLYHPVFGRFLKNLQSPEPLSANNYKDTDKYFVASQDLYAEEQSRKPDSARKSAVRDGSTRDLLGPLLGGLLVNAGEPGTHPDGVAVTDNAVWCMIMEMKNEIGMGGSDPSIQASESYARVWKTLRDPVKRCCCPSILVAIAGPWMTILGAIFLERPVIQPLTDFLWVGDNPSQPSNLDRLARVFRSLAEARNELKTYYANLPSPDQVGASAFPYPTHYVDSTGRRIEFKYEKHVNRSSRPSDKKDLVFFARTVGDTSIRIVVKFVTRYNSDAHRLLAKEGLAPELLYDGTADPTNQPGPEYSMIIMEYISGGDLGNNTNPITPGFGRDVERAIKLLHSQDLVFGDLRAPNIIPVRDATKRVTWAKLIDFDWCGEHQKGRYPPIMNEKIVWASEVEPGALLDKAHDEEMLIKLRARWA